MVISIYSEYHREELFFQFITLIHSVVLPNECLMK